MLSNIGFMEFLLIAIIALLIFGPKKLPEIGRAMGRTVQEFKKGMKGVTEDEQESVSSSAKDESTNLSSNAKPKQETKSNLPE